MKVAIMIYILDRQINSAESWTWLKLRALADHSAQTFKPFQPNHPLIQQRQLEH